MTTQAAKQILSLYRPGTADAEDTTFAEALQLCEQDAELRLWFEDHCLVYESLRAKLKQITVPEGFKEQIVAERKVHAPGFWTRRPVRIATATMALAVASMLLFFQWRTPGEDTSFAGFRERMISKALRSYGMDLETDSPDRVRALLAERKAIADYVLPPGLQKARLTGCLVTTWQGKPVSAICYQSGKPLLRGQSSDLWLFVTESSSVPGAPRNSSPSIQTFNTVTAASWSHAGKTYVLAIDGDEASLRKYL
jgi:hypothetical protein